MILKRQADSGRYQKAQKSARFHKAHLDQYQKARKLAQLVLTAFWTSIKRLKSR